MLAPFPVPAPQRATGQRHSASTIVGGRAHPQMFGAQAAEQPLRDAKLSANLRHAHILVRPALKQVLKSVDPGHRQWTIAWINCCSSPCAAWASTNRWGCVAAARVAAAWRLRR